MVRVMIYIAAPYTQGDVAENIKKVIEVADEVALRPHFIPFVPHLTHLWHIISPHPWEFWMAIDLHFLHFANCVLRLPGESTGADQEDVIAKELGIPLVYSL